jgi:hypothetical protein
VALALSTQPDVMRGMVRLAASGVPNGDIVVTRRYGSAAPVSIRGGLIPGLITGGFVLSDPEPNFGTDLVYRVVDTVANRYLQTNTVTNPRFATGTSGWTWPAARVTARETDPALVPPRDATTSLRIGPGAQGAGGLPDRLLATTSPVGLTTGRWFLTGQVRYDSPNIWLWQDVRDAGTWQTIKNKGTWQDVKATQAPAAAQAFASLWVGVNNPVGGASIVAPFQVLGVQTDANGMWTTFQVWIDIPAGAPANCQLAFYQGTATREYAVTWWMTTLLVSPEREVTAESPVYFDGSTPVGELGDLGSKLAPGLDWKALTGDASVAWSGTPNASTSVLTGPSQIFSESSTSIGTPTISQLPRVKIPVFLSDPVAPQLAQWFELLEIGDLGYAARQDLFDVLGRGAQIAVSQLRAWPSGELRVLTYTPEAAEIAERLFGTGRILYWRNPDPRYPENGWYIAVGDLASGRVGATVAWSPERIWRIPFVKVERPEGLISAATSVSWSTVKTSYTWQQLRDQRTDWLDVALTEPGA